MSIVPIRRQTPSTVAAVAGADARPMASIGDLVAGTIRRLRILQDQAAKAGRADLALAAECAAAMVQSHGR